MTAISLKVRFFLALFLGVCGTCVHAQSLFFEGSTPEPGYELNSPIEFDPYEFGFDQQLKQSMVSSTISAIATFPLLAIKTDVQAGQPINLKPKHLTRGMGAGVLRTIPANTALVLTTGILGSDDASPLQTVGAGVAGGLVASTFFSPMELVITKQRLRKESAWETIRHIRESQGWRGFSQGFRATAGRDILSSGFGLTIIPVIVDGLSPDALDDSDAGTAVKAAIGGAIGGVLSLPFDVARGHYQRMDLQKGMKTPSLLTVFKETAEKEGMEGLFKAYPYRAMQIGLSLAVITVIRNSIQDSDAEFNQSKEDLRLQVLAEAESNRGDEQAFLRERVRALQKRVGVRTPDNLYVNNPEWVPSRPEKYSNYVIAEPSTANQPQQGPTPSQQYDMDPEVTVEYRASQTSSMSSKSSSRASSKALAVRLKAEAMRSKMSMHHQPFAESHELGPNNNPAASKLRAKVEQMRKKIYGNGNNNYANQ